MTEKPTGAGEAEDSAFSPAFHGWRSFRYFADSVKRRSRYVGTGDTSEFLSVVEATAESHRIDVALLKFEWVTPRLG